MKPLNTECTAAMNEYVAFIQNECLGEGETFELGSAWIPASPKLLIFWACEP